jgi:hypothetical protein
VDRFVMLSVLKLTPMNQYMFEKKRVECQTSDFSRDQNVVDDL